MLAGCSVDIGKLRPPHRGDAASYEARADKDTPAGGSPGVDGWVQVVPDGGRDQDSSTNGAVDVAFPGGDLATGQEDSPVADRPSDLALEDAGQDPPSDAPLGIESPVDAPTDTGDTCDADASGAAGGAGGSAGDASGTGGSGGAVDGGGGDSRIAADAGTVGPAWTKIANRSPKFSYPAVAYDPTSQRAALFGGFNNCDESLAANQTWEWDGSAWTRVTATGPIPTPRGAISMAFDRARGEALIHGGWSPPNMLLAGTYAYKLATHAWAPRGGMTLSLDWYTLGYDTEANLVRMFGGMDFSTFYRTVRTWNATLQTWQDVVADDGPEGRARHAWAFDQEHRRFVMFGGASSRGGSHLSDTWEFDPATSTWQETATAGVHPLDCDLPAPMTYDPDRKLMVMYCASNGGETWEYDAGTHAWSQAVGANQAGVLTGASMFYDEKLQSVLLVGGCKSGALQDVTWQFIPAP